MSWIDELVADYGRNLGLSDVRLDETGTACVQFDQLGELFFERLDSGLLIYLVRAYELPLGGVLVAALQAVHWNQNPPFAVTAARHGDNHLLFSAHLAEEGLDLPTIERAISYLGALHEDIREGALT